MNHISLNGKSRCYAKSPTMQDAVRQIPGMHWGDREMGTATSCTKYSQVAGMYVIHVYTVGTCVCTC